MEKITKEFEVFTFDELSEKSKEKVLQKLGEYNIEYDWYEFVYEDAKNIGIEIESFDLYRHEIEGQYINSPDEVIEAILNDHGKQCETYKTAIEYKEKLNSFGLDEYNDKIEDEDTENDFRNSLLEDYRIMLQKEYDYLISEEAIKEMIESNEYKFLENGEIFN